MATRSDVIHRALRDLGVTAVDDAADADDFAYAGAALDALFAEIAVSPGLTFSFALSGTIPDTHLTPLAWLTANRIPAYERAAPVPWTTALMLLKAVNNPYVRDMDLDDDGTTTEEEIDTFDHGAYF